MSADVRIEGKRLTSSDPVSCREQSAGDRGINQIDWTTINSSRVIPNPIAKTQYCNSKGQNSSIAMAAKLFVAAGSDDLSISDSLILAVFRKKSNHTTRIIPMAPAEIAPPRWVGCGRRRNRHSTNATAAWAAQPITAAVKRRPRTFRNKPVQIATSVCRQYHAVDPRLPNSS